MYVLTREDARHRSAVVTVRHIDVTLHLEEAATEKSSYRVLSRMTLVSQEPTLFVDVAGEVQAVSIDDVPLAPDQFTYDGERLDISAVPTDREVTISVEADCRFSTTGEGLHRYRDPEDGRYYLYTQFEPQDAHRAWPCFDQPDMKPTWTFHVYAPCEWVVTSNGIGSSKDCGNGITLWDFTTTPPLSSYITAVVAGQWALVDGGIWEGSAGDGNTATLQLRLLCRQALASSMDSDDILAVTRAGLDHYHKHYGYTFPWGSYDQIFVPEYNLGAMENPGCITFNENYLSRDTPSFALRQKRANTILHEMCHMWFGDLVTPAWWENLWLKESFAENQGTTTAAEATIYTGEWASFAIGRKAWALAQDQYPTTHPIVADIPDIPAAKNNFDGITYAKGASVLRQMVAWVGQENFMAALKVYFDKHSWGNTVLDDLLVELERTSGRDVRAWSAKWLETAGVNTLAVEVENDEAGNISSLGIRQSYAEGFETLRPHRAVIGFYNLVDGKLTRTDRIELDIDGELTVVEEALGKKRPDLLLLNDEDLAYAKIRLDERSIETAIKHLGDIDSSVARGVVWGSLWDTVRDAQMPARKYVDLVLNNIGKETNSTALRTQINNLSATLHSFVAPEAREETRHRAADRLWELACVAEPDSDAQLQLLQAFINQTRTEEQYDNVQRLFEGDLTLEGLEIDADLRWNLVCRLATGGRFSAEQIAAELENDNTANGQQYAAQAYASIPTAEAKAEYWNKIMVTGELSNMIQRYAISGFKSGEPELIAQYDEPYFEQIEGIWRSRSHEISMQIIGGMYPSEPTAELLERTEAYLASLPEDAAALYRQIAEARDGVARALKVQAADI